MLQISQRLRGVKEDGEAIEEDGFMPKLKKAFGDVGVEIEDQNGELRSTFDILNDLAGVWDTLSSKQRQYLGEKAAGNRQVKVLNAIMANWDVVEDTIRDAEEATGAATEGNEKYLDSIEGRITQFKSAFQDLSRTTVNSDLVKNIVSIGTALVNATTSVGGLTPVVIALTGLFTAFKTSKIQKGFDSLKEAFSSKGIGGSIGKIGLFVTGFTVAVTAISALEKRLDSFNVLESSKNKYQASISNLEATESQLDGVRTKISSIKSLGTLSFIDQQELTKLEQTEAQLEAQYEIQKKIAEVQKEAAQADFEKLFTNYDSYSTGYAGFDFLNELKQFFGSGFSEGSPFAFIGEGLSEFGVNVEDWGKSNKEIFVKAVDDFKKAQTEIRNRNIETFNALQANEMSYFASSNVITNNVSENLKARNEAFDNLNKALEIYNKYQAASQGIERNDVTEPYFQMLDQMGESINSAMQYMHDLDDALRTPFEEILKSDTFSSVSDALIELAQKGELTKDTLSDVSGVNSFIETIGTLGITAQDAARYINELYSVEQTEETGGVSNKFASIEELITNNYLASDSYKALSTAMTEQQKSGAISMETYQKLIATDKQLANVLTLTANGYTLNSDAVNEYVQAKADEQKIQAMLSYDEQQQKLEELKKRYEDLNNGLIEVDDLQTEIANNESAQKAAEQNMEALEAYIREINSATSALTRFKAAQSSANEDANFQDSKKVYDVIKEGNKTGKRNTDDFKTAVDYVLGDNWRDNLDQFGGSVEKAYEHAEKLSKRYSGQKDEKTAVDNFMKDVGKTGLGTYDSKTGSLELNEGVTLGELSEKMKVSKEYLTDMFKLLNTYAGEGEGFFFPEFFTDDDKKQLEERKKALEENENSQEQVGNTIEDINKKIAKAEEEGNKEEVKRLEGQKEGLEEAQKVLQQQHTDLEAGAPITPDVDTMTLEDAKKKIDELSDTIRTLQGAGISIPVYLPPALDVLLNKFPGLINQLKEPTTITVEEKGSEEASTKLTQVKDDAEGIPDSTTTKVEEQGATETTNKLSDVGSTAEDIKDDVNVNVKEEGAEEAKEKIQGVSNGPYDPASIGAEADNASLSSVGKELDDLAKPRTVTYTPQIPEMPVPIDVPLDDSDGTPKEPSKGRTKTADEQRSEDEWNNWFDWFDGTYRNGGKTEQSVEVGVEASQESGKQIVKQVQEQIDSESPVQEKIENNSDGMILFPGDEGYDELGVNVTAANPEEPIQQVQEAASGTPVELQFDFGDLTQLGSTVQSLIGSAEGAGVGDTSEGAGAISNLRQAYIELSNAMEKTKDLEVGDVSGAEQAASEIQNAANNFTTAYNTLSTMTSSLTVDPIEFDADTSKAVKKVQAIGEKGVTVKVDGNTSSLASAIDSYDNRTITVNIQTNEIGGNAKGTRNAAPGPSLVDEEGAELIEHVNRGTYELGTNNGPRMTNLEKGDIVHTASETKRILSRVSKIGGFFKNGLNQAKSVLTGGAFRYAQDSGIGGKVTNTKKSTKKKKSSSKKSSSSSKKSSKSSSTNMKKLQEWFEKLFDWAEIRLERLQTITDEWIYKAGQAIGYAAQNTQLANAMKSVENQIKDTTAAYNLYIAQADKVAKKTKLSADIINRIQNGTIEISSYDKNTQQKIQFYKEWLNFSCHFE